MNIINRLGQSAYLLQGDFLCLAGRSSLEGAVWRIGRACRWDISVTSSVVGPWGMMADGIFCIGGLTCSATLTCSLADDGADVGTSMDFCHFC
jgi:hypothetical protein